MTTPTTNSAPSDSAPDFGPDSILIVDFGSQVTQLIARRLRELKVYCEIKPYQSVTPEFLDAFDARAVI
ncbi:MAG: GMP synthase (glutamine-hydrolyzing), partial [Pseudomonadota bacterium]